MHLTSWCLLGALAVGAQEASFWSFLGDGQVVTRCAEQSTAHAQAAARLQRLDQQIERLQNAAPIAAVVAELHDLLKTECFRPAVETDRIPNPDTALSLKAWWTDGGGRNWLASFLELPRLGLIDNLMPHVVVPADVRRTLSLEGHQDHPLRTLLCPLSDAACAAETRGWMRRAEAYFDAHRAIDRDDDSEALDKPSASAPEEVSQQCAEKTVKAEAGQRYQQWRACIESARPKHVALPLGSFKAPKTGWFVIAGRRGHYDFCDTVRAYDLRTGAAFIDESCSALALIPGGHVDVDATNARRVRRVRAGVIPAENLREAVWLLLLRGEAEELQLTAEYYPLPPGVTPQLTVKHDDHGSGTSFTWRSSTAQTSLTWRWRPDTGAAFMGDLTWPNSFGAAESHAASLLGIAEDGFVEGCPPRQAPTLSVLTSPRVHHLNELAADEIGEFDRELRDAVRRWMRGRCS